MILIGKDGYKLKKKVMLMILKALPFILLTLSMLVLPNVSASEPLPLKNVSITIMVYPESFDDFIKWIKPYSENFRNFSIVIGKENNIFDWYLHNQTKIDLLSSIGEVIPLTAFLQAWTPQQRIAYLKQYVVDEWVNHTGKVPNGLFAFQPDTYISNWLPSQGVNYIMGYCFDQYVVDWMSMRGGWQLPYYASSINALMPENQTAGGTVILPWLTWDWISSFTLSHNYDTHLVDVGGTQVLNQTAYIIDLIEANLDSAEPFGYSAFSFEYDWLKLLDRLDVAGSIISYLIKNPNYGKLSNGDFTDWFKKTYASTPAYAVYFTSPYNAQTIEWFYNQQYRVAKYKGIVVSFLEYGKQGPDRYLTEEANIDLSKRQSLNNSIDNSLNFTIDGLGGGLHRAPVRDNIASYDEGTMDFSGYIMPHPMMMENLPNPTLTPTPTIQKLPNPKNDSSKAPLIPELNLSVVLLIMLAMLLLPIWSKFFQAKKGSMAAGIGLNPESKFIT